MKSPNNKKTQGFIYILLISIAGLTVYINSLNGQFILDDNHLVVNNIFIKKWSNITNIFTESVRTGAGRGYRFYRPIQILTYMIDYRLWGLDTKGYHLTNTILHIAASLCVYWMVNVLYKNRPLAFLTGIIFIIHPIHTEAIAYISGRSDPLALIFMLISFILYIKKLYISACLMYIIAILSRENSIILPLLLLLYHYSSRKNIRLKEFFPALIITFAYIILRLSILKELLSTTSAPPTLAQRIPGFFAAFAAYIKLLFLPFNLHMEYGANLFRLYDLETITGLILFSITIYTVMKIRRTFPDNLAFFSLSWYLITLLPVSNIYLLNAYMAEHWLYIPSMGFCLLLANILLLLYKDKNLRIFSTYIATFLLIYFSCLTIKQNHYWKEPNTFYEHTLRYNPRSATMYNDLGVIYYKRGKIDEALELFKRAIDVNPNYAGAYINIGNISFMAGKTEEALALFNKAVEIDPKLIEGYMCLGAVYSKIGKVKEAINSFKKIIEINPYYAPAHNDLAVLYCIDKHYDLATKHCEKAIKMGYEASPDLLETLKSNNK